jgi:hypothetical protein
VGIVTVIDAVKSVDGIATAAKGLVVATARSWQEEESCKQK